MDPKDKLEEARSAASEGRYADALAGFIWFHDEALKHDPSLYGVRLSFALSYWVDLGRHYPEALRALESIRDAKDASLVAGARRRELFHDVVAINESLDMQSRTCVLIRRLFEADAEFARSCGDIAMPALVRDGDFSLALEFLPDPMAHVKALGRQLDESVQLLRDSPSATRSSDGSFAVHARIYADEVRLILAVLAGAGRTGDSASLLEFAVSNVRIDSVRETVRGLLLGDGEAR